MNRCLYMICPTDHLESVINNRFTEACYFYTSLGNMTSLNERTLRQIVELIEKNDIQEITFILSTDNNILLDALNNQCFIETRGLNKAYGDFLKYKTQIAEIWSTHRKKDLIISYHLHQKIKVLRTGLSEFLLNIPDINGQIYSKSNNSFRPIHSPVVFLNYCQLS
jgi:hypothetical protein